MTHKTGNRPRAVKAFTRQVREAIDRCKPRPTISELVEVFHEETVRNFRRVLAPIEDQTCPTCPKKRQ